MPETDGGALVARTLHAWGVRWIFTLCGGHISPILVAAKRLGIRVVDVRHEATAVFAADAVARLTGRPGVACVTAGPGVTNTVTALKNAQLARSPVLLLGGAAATLLRGRGALQDIDQLRVVRPHVKYAGRVERVRDIPTALSRAWQAAASHPRGPAYAEFPLDVLYPERVVREFFASGHDANPSLAERVVRWHLERRLARVFSGDEGVLDVLPPAPAVANAPRASARGVQRAVSVLSGLECPLLLVGSEAVCDPALVPELVRAVETLGVPVYLSGMARGLLGADHPLLLRHRRRQALAETDGVILCGVPCDFRLGYGRHIRRDAALIAVGGVRRELRMNRRPSLGLLGAPASFLVQLAEAACSSPRYDPGAWSSWSDALQRRDLQREAEIEGMAEQDTSARNPVALLKAVDEALAEDSVIVADGGDFAATASYVLRPRGPLSWLDPGPFGTLGAGAGFALGAALARPGAEVWIIYGDGSAAFSLMEYDTFVRHGVPVIGVIGNDGSWMQIARDQVRILGDPVATELRTSAYHLVAEGLGARGLLLDEAAPVAEVIGEAKRARGAGAPVLVNAHIGRTDFRAGSLSI